MTEIRFAIDTPYFTESLDCLWKNTANTTSDHFYLSMFKRNSNSFSQPETMKIVYTTLVDKDVDYPPSQFAREVAIYLSDPDGWVSEGYTFVRGSSPAVVIHLSSPEYLAKNGCKDPSLSCAEMNGRHMYLNAMRWTKGAPQSKLELDAYRQYMVSHEMGHILGREHVDCPREGAPVPIMVQQTKGIGKCKPNTKLTERDRK